MKPEEQTAKQPSKFAYIVYALLPVAVVFLWQMATSFLGIGVYTVVKSMVESKNGTTLSPEALMELAMSFVTSDIYVLFTLLIYAGYLVIFLPWYLKAFPKIHSEQRWKQVLHPGRIVAVFILGVGIQVVFSQVLMVILVRIPALYDRYASLLSGLKQNDLCTMFTLIVLAPIGEELIFRGLSLRYLKKAVPWQLAIVIQALLFGLYHLNLVQFSYCFILGLLFGYIAHRYGSVVPGILLHMALNGSSYLWDLVPESVGQDPKAAKIIFLICLVCSIAAAWFYLWGIPTEKFKQSEEKGESTC